MKEDITYAISACKCSKSKLNCPIKIIGIGCEGKLLPKIRTKN